MTPDALVPWFAWLAPRLLLLFGLGFLVANIIAITEVVRYHRGKRSAILLWPRPRPRYYAVSLLLGVILGLLLVAEVLLKRPVYSLFGEAMMFLYYICLFPLRARVARGFYAGGIWSDSGFMKWADISAVSWKDEPTVTLVLISQARHIARRLDVPGHLYGQARRLLQDRIKAHDMQIGGAGLDLGSREGQDRV